MRGEVRLPPPGKLKGFFLVFGFKGLFLVDILDRNFKKTV